MPTVVIAAGGTAGHVVPALAVADELRASGAEVVFVGTRERAEAQLVPAAGYPIYLPVRPRAGPPQPGARDGARSARAGAARRRRPGGCSRRLGADAVLAGGGYVAGPVGLAAVSRRTPLVLSEADSHLGLANRMLAPFARRVCLAFPIDGREGERYLVTGPAGAAGGVEADRAQRARAPGHRRADAPCVLVFGGQPRRALRERRRGRGVGRRGRARAAHHRAARLRRGARAVVGDRPGYQRARVSRTRSPTRSRRATS